MRRKRKVKLPKCCYLCEFHGLHNFSETQIKYNIKKGFTIFCNKKQKCVVNSPGFPNWCPLNEEERRKLIE